MNRARWRMSQLVRAEGVSLFGFRATARNFSSAMIKLDAAMRNDRLRDDDNPVLESCLGNVVRKPDPAAT
jgi:phage terminase large subunit-like protein